MCYSILIRVKNKLSVALIMLSGILLLSSCDPVNTVSDPHFTDDGYCLDSIKESFSVEKPLLAVIDAGKVVKYGKAPHFLKPAGTMPMIWTAQNGFITIKIRKNIDGSYNLIKDKEKNNEQ